MTRPAVFLVASVLAVSLIVPAVAHACAVCLTGAGTGDPLTEAFNWSVLFLMATPYTVVGSVGGWLFYSHWRASHRAGEPGKKSSILHL